MSLSLRLRACALPVMAATAMATMLAISSPALANDPPQVAVNGAEAGNMQLNNPVSFQGVTRDSDGIKEIYGTIQNQSNMRFVDQSGGLTKEPARIKFKFNRDQATRWVSQAFNLPRGNYVFRIRVEDGNKAISPMMEVPFIATGRAGANMAAAQQPQQPAPKPAQQQQQQQQQVAQTTPVTPTAAAAVTGAKAANGMLYCSNKGNDADGDGFGWENDASCVIAGSKADKHPTCASSSSDPDGDGYGWENERSCIVVVHCASAASDPDGDGFGWENERSCVVLKKASNSKHPSCQKGKASDPDGDGYGWENNATCLVQ